MKQELTSNKTYKSSFNLEERTLLYSKKIIFFVKKLQSNNVNNQLIPQFIRSATSIGANYREANDALGKKDFLMRIKICRKEAKETKYWLELMRETNPNNIHEIDILISETIEYIKIFSTIIIKSR